MPACPDLHTRAKAIPKWRHIKIQSLTLTPPQQGTSLAAPILYRPTNLQHIPKRGSSSLTPVWHIKIQSLTLAPPHQGTSLAAPILCRQTHPRQVPMQSSTGLIPLGHIKMQSLTSVPPAAARRAFHPAYRLAPLLNRHLPTRQNLSEAHAAESASRTRWHFFIYFLIYFLIYFPLYFYPDLSAVRTTKY